MLEKNKDYVEMRVSSTDCAFVQNGPIQICIDGHVYTSYMDVPDPGEFYIFISKEKFEKMQADVNINAEIAKQWEINYDLLLKKIGFDTVEELVNYLNSEAECDTLREAIASLAYSVKFARDERRDLSKKLDECEKDYISERDKAEALQTENEQLKKKLHEFDPIPDYKELLEKLYSKDDVEKLEWTLNHICGGQASVNGWMVTAKLWKRNYETLSKLVGFSSTEEIQDYLTNEAECDTLQEAVSKLKDQVKYTCEEWYGANSSNNSWKAAAECNLPKELIEKLNLLRDDISGRSTVIERYKRDIEKWQKATGCLRPEDISTASLVTKAMQLDQEVKILNGALQEWREGTGCPGPIAAKALIESGMAYEHGFHEAQEENRKLTEEVDSWKNVTGYSTPEDYMRVRINNATPFDYTAAWQDATGCVTPDQVKSRIEGLENAVRLTNRNMIKEIESSIDEWQKFTGCDSPQESGCKINSLCDEICKLKGDYDRLLKLTGYKSEEYIHVMLNGDKHKYPHLHDLINSLKRNSQFTEANWQKATGCDTPEVAEKRLKYYNKRLSNAVQAARCAEKHLDNITL